MTTRTLIAGLNENFNPLVLPGNINSAFRDMFDAPASEDYDIRLGLTYRRNMFQRKSREYKQLSFLLATFVQGMLEFISKGVMVSANQYALDEVLSYMDDYDIERVFETDEECSVSHIQHFITFQKRVQPLGKGKNAKQRTDYILTFSRRLFLGGRQNPELGRHNIITHMASDYRDQYAAVESQNPVLPHVDHFLQLLE